MVNNQFVGRWPQWQQSARNSRRRDRRRTADDCYQWKRGKCLWQQRNFKAILGDPGVVNRGARKINRRDEGFHESLQRGVKEPLGTDSYQTISKRLGECLLLIGQKNPLYYSAQSANSSFWGTFVCSYTAIVAWYFSGSYLRGKLSF